MATYVLIHGAGSDSWFWHRVVPELRARGHDVVTPDLPCDDDSAGLDRYVDVVVNAIGGRRNLIVVAQSLAGFVGPLVCARVPADLLVLLNAMVGKDLKNPDDVYHCHQVVQALRDITAQRFGFEPQTGQDILTAATALEQQSALRRWFGWWRLNAKTFEAVLTPQLKNELEKRKRRKERFGR